MRLFKNWVFFKGVCDFKLIFNWRMSVLEECLKYSSCNFLRITTLTPIRAIPLVKLNSFSDQFIVRAHRFKSSFSRFNLLLVIFLHLQVCSQRFAFILFSFLSTEFVNQKTKKHIRCKAKRVANCNRNDKRSWLLRFMSYKKNDYLIGENNLADKNENKV